METINSHEPIHLFQNGLQGLLSDNPVYAITPPIEIPGVGLVYAAVAQRPDARGGKRTSIIYPTGSVVGDQRLQPSDRHISVVVLPHSEEERSAASTLVCQLANNRKTLTATATPLATDGFGGGYVFSRWESKPGDPAPLVVADMNLKEIAPRLIPFSITFARK